MNYQDRYLYVMSLIKIKVTFLFLGRINMKKLLVLLSTVSVIAAAGRSETSSPLDNMGSLADALQEGYSSDTEYARHQKVHERFFRRTTKNETAKAAITIFKGEVTSASNLSPIDLDGLSSRTRIIMFRQLIAAALEIKKIDISNTDGKTTVLSIPLKFHGKEFALDLFPTSDQPGNGILTCIGSYEKEVHPVIESYKEKAQAKFSKKLTKARTAQHTPGQQDYHPAIPNPNLEEDGKKVNLEALNLLLDFEVARRLIGSQTEENAAHVVVKGATAMTSPIKQAKNEYAVRFDSVPVASSIVGLLKLPQQSKTDGTYEVPLESFFDGAIVEIAGKTFRNGKYNAFEGSAGNPQYFNNPPHRALATKKIIRKLRGGEQATPSTKEQIHQEYLTYFGGASESEGESYDTPVASDS